MKKIKFTLCFAGIFLLNQAATAQTSNTESVTFAVGQQFSNLFTGAAASCGGFALTVQDVFNQGIVTLVSPQITGATTPITGTTVKIVFTAIKPGTDVYKVTANANSPCTDTTVETYGITVTPAVPSTEATTPKVGKKAEPVSTATGELFGHDETADLTTNGPLPLTFRRYYASYLSANNVSSGLGTNWMSNYDVSLAVSGSAATVTLFRGKTVTFKQSSGAWQLSSVEQRPYQLIAAGSGYQFLDPRSNLIYGFNSAGALTSIQDRNGNTLTVTPGPGGPTQVADGLGRTLAFTYTGANLTKLQDQAGRTFSYEYTSGALSAWTDANGNRSTISYTSIAGNVQTAVINGLMTTLTRPAGNQPLSQTFDSQGRVSTQSPAVGAAMKFTYNSGSNGATVAEPGGPTLTDVNDANDNLTSTTDAAGVASKFTYDANNRKLTSTDRTGATESVTYDSASGLPATRTDQAGNKTSFTYAATTTNGLTFYDLTGLAFADGTSVTYVHDGKGNVTAFTDQAGKTWQFTYNAAGQVLTSTNPSGGVTTLAYGADATLSSAQLPFGDTTTLAYDAVKRPNLVTNPDATTRTAKYDGLDNPTSATDERSNTGTESVDANGNLHTLIDAVNAATTFAYDADDRLSSTTDALGHAITRAYDAVNRLQSVTDASGVSINYAYDSLNRAIGVTDAAGKGLTLGWDQEARLTSVTDALSRTASVTRDPRGLVTSVTTPNGENISAAYDALGRTASTTDPLSRTTNFAYDPRGLLSSLSLPGGVNASYVFNELGFLTGATDPRGNLWATAYDKQGRAVSRTDPLGQTTSVQYDSRQRVAAVTFPKGSLQNTYDATSNLTVRNYSDGTNLTYMYDADNRLTGASGLSLAYDLNGRISNSNGIQIARDPAGRIASITYAAGKTVQYTYDNRGLLIKVTDWVGGNTTFTYDAAHQLSSRTFPNGVAETFTYDKDGRLLSIQVANGSTAISSIALTRDALGRVTSAVRSAPTVPNVPTGYLGLAYDAASQSYASTYDTLGRATQDALAGRTYSWDLASRLASYSGSNGSSSFTYDAFGQRISSTTGGVTQNYVLNYALPLPSVATVQTGGADLRYYIWLPNGALLESIEAAANTRHFYHFDESGTTNFLTTDSGAVTDSYATTPYGETIVQTGSTPNPFTFQGAFGVMQEGATGLYYMRARYYDSASARFLSRDPVIQTDPRALSPYQFAFASPVEGRDPSGRAEISGPFGPIGLPTLPVGNTLASLDILTTDDYSLGTLPPQPAAAECPSFAATATDIATVNTVTFASCSTNLLFPYGTNANGFETGIAIANTSTAAIPQLRDILRNEHLPWGYEPSFNEVHLPRGYEPSFNEFVRLTLDYWNRADFERRLSDSLAQDLSLIRSRGGCAAPPRGGGTGETVTTPSIFDDYVKSSLVPCDDDGVPYPAAPVK